MKAPLVAISMPCRNIVRNGILRQCAGPTQRWQQFPNGYDITATYSAELALVTDATALVRRLNLVLCAGQMSEANQNLIIGALNATPVTATSTDSVKLNRVAAAVLMVMGCSEYLIQK